MKLSGNLAGQKIGRWTVMDDCTFSASGERKWLCRCECGNGVEVSYNSLMYTHIQNCGCQKKERERKLGNFLTHVAGISEEILEIPKKTMNNTKSI